MYANDQPIQFRLGSALSACQPEKPEKAEAEKAEKAEEAEHPERHSPPFRFVTLCYAKNFSHLDGACFKNLKTPFSSRNRPACHVPRGQEILTGALASPVRRIRKKFPPIENFFASTENIENATLAFPHVTPFFRKKFFPRDFNSHPLKCEPIRKDVDFFPAFFAFYAFLRLFFLREKRTEPSDTNQPPLSLRFSNKHP